MNMKMKTEMRNVKATVLGTLDYAAGQAKAAFTGKRKVFTLLGTGMGVGAMAEPAANMAVRELQTKIAIMDYLRENGMKADSKTVDYLAATVMKMPLMAEPAQDDQTKMQKGPGVGTTTVTWTGIKENATKEMEVGLRIQSSILDKVFGMKNGFTENWIGYRREVKGLEMMNGKEAIINLYIGQEGLILVVVPKDNPTAQNAITMMIPVKMYMDSSNEYRVQLEGQNLIVLGADGKAYVMNVDQHRLASTSANWDGNPKVQVSMDASGVFAVAPQTEGATSTTAPYMNGKIKVETPDTTNFIPGVVDITEKSKDATAKVGVVLAQTGTGTSESRNIAIEGGKTPVGNAYNYEMTEKQMTDYLGATTFTKGDRTINALAWIAGYRGMPKSDGAAPNAKATVTVPNNKNANGSTRDAYPFDLTYSDVGGKGTLNRVGEAPSFKRMSVPVTENSTNDVGLVTGKNGAKKTPKNLSCYDATNKVTITVKDMSIKEVTGITGTADANATTLNMMVGKKQVGSLKVDKPVKTYTYGEIAVQIGTQKK